MGSIAQRRRGVRVCALVLSVVVTLLGACAEPTFPADADDTLKRVMAERVLRVGVSENLPWTEVSDDGSVSGPEADILTAYAETLGASVDWTPGAESQLILLLEQGDLDVVIGGLRSDSPWAAKAALTRPHAKTVGPDGKEEKLVFACRLGENAMLSNVERFLIRQDLQP